jgi:hypothetical protein
LLCYQLIGEANSFFSPEASTMVNLPLDEQRRLLEIDSGEAGDYGQGIMAKAA